MHVEMANPVRAIGECRVMQEVFAPVIVWVLTAILGAVVGWLTGKIKSIKAKKSELIESNKRLAADIDELTLMVCRLTIYNERFSIEEKLEAYSIYRSKGGNHYAKREMDKLLGEDVDDYLERHPI